MRARWTLTADGRLVLGQAHAAGGRITARSASAAVEVAGTVYSDSRRRAFRGARG